MVCPFGAQRTAQAMRGDAKTRAEAEALARVRAVASEVAQELAHRKPLLGFTADFDSS